MFYHSQLLYRNIDLIDKKLNTQSPGGSIILKCKDFRILQLDINSTDDLTNVILSIEKLMSQGGVYFMVICVECIYMIHIVC